MKVWVGTKGSTKAAATRTLARRRASRSSFMGLYEVELLAELEAELVSRG